MTDKIKEFIQEARDRWGDHYWHADHPEVKAALIAIVTGLIGLLFAFLEIKLRENIKLPDPKDV